MTRRIVRTPRLRPPWADDPDQPVWLSTNHLVVTFKRKQRPRNGHGTIDYDLRLWQHSSTTKGIAGSTYNEGFAYGLEDEWALILEHADFIEFHDRKTRPMTFYRIAVAVAKREGYSTVTKNGPRWIVPLEFYEITRQSRNAPTPLPRPEVKVPSKTAHRSSSASSEKRTLSDPDEELRKMEARIRASTSSGGRRASRHRPRD